jgi:anaerobic selenocysteine-containing dehydrogenase
MAKRLSDYIKMLQKITRSRPVFEPSPYQWKEVDRKAEPERKVLHGLCGSCMARECATLVHVEDGVVVKIEGNREAPPNFGVLCAKGNSEIMALYNPYRVKVPLVRTNPEKGLDVDPMWREVTWDEALSIVADRLRKVREKDPRGLVICDGFGNWETLLRNEFGLAFGTPNFIGSHGPLCALHYASCLVHAGFPEAIADVEYCEYLVTLGRSLGANFATSGPTRRFAKAIERGMKLVVIDPRSSCEASKGEWVPIRPGTDLALLLALAHVMMHEGLQYDVRFMKNRTNAPYLIGPDGNYHRDPDTGKPMMWDPVQQCARTFDAGFQDVALTGTYTVNNAPCRTGFDIIKEEFAKYTPAWAETICTVPAATIRRIAHEFVEHARIGSTIEIDGFTFPFRPVSVNTHRGVVSHRNGTYADLTGKIINMLVGNIEVPGGVLGNNQRGPWLAPDEDGVVKPYFEAVPAPFTFPPEHIDCHEFYPNRHQTPQLAIKAILEPERYYHNYRIETWISIGANPVAHVVQPQVFVEAFKKIPFSVAFAYHMDETSILADVVLPDHCALERSVVAALCPPHQTISNEVSGLHMVRQRQPVPPVFDTRHTDDILMELADRLGILYGKDGLYDRLNRKVDKRIYSDGLNLNAGFKLDPDKKHSLEEIFDRQLRGWPHGDGRGLDDLKETGFIARWVPRKEFYTYYYHPENKTRHPFYFQHLKHVGDTLRANLAKHNITFPGIDDPETVFDLYRPVPHWVEGTELAAPADFDLFAITWRTPFWSNETHGLTGNPWLAELSMQDGYAEGVYMNRETAHRKHLKEGDAVVIESRYGRTEGCLRVTELLHPEIVGIPGCFGLGTLLSNPLNRRGANWNSLAPIDDACLDPVSGGCEGAPRVRVYRKADGP